MLILKLYPGQTIWIGTDIQVTVLGNMKGLVRIGIQTRQLQDIKVAEEELWDRGPFHEPK